MDRDSKNTRPILPNTHSAKSYLREYLPFRHFLQYLKKLLLLDIFAAQLSTVLFRASFHHIALLIKCNHLVLQNSNFLHPRQTEQNNINAQNYPRTIGIDERSNAQLSLLNGMSHVKTNRTEKQFERNCHQFMAIRI